MALQFPSLKRAAAAFTERLNSIKLPGADQAAVFARTEELIETLNNNFAMSMGNIFMGAGKSIKDARQLFSKMKDKSPLLVHLEDIVKSVDNIFSTKGEYGETYDLLRTQTEALLKMSDDSIVKDFLTVTSLKELMNGNALATAGAQEKAKKGKGKTPGSDKTLKISVKGLDAKSALVLKELAAIKVTKTSAMSAAAMKNLSDLLTSVATLTEVGGKKLDKKLAEKIIFNLKEIEKVIEYLNTDFKKVSDEWAKNSDQIVQELDKVTEVFSSVAALGTASEGAKSALGQITDLVKSVGTTAQSIAESAQAWQAAAESMDKMGQFVVLAGFTMMVGAAVMMIPGMAISALKFGATLSAFIALVILPITLIAQIGPADYKGIAKLSIFVATAAAVMSLGATFIMLGGGKFASAALTFGMVLAEFIGVVLLPIAIYGILLSFASKKMGQIAILISVASLVMMVGALFVLLGGGKIAQASLVFGMLLGQFLSNVMMPICIWGLLMGLAGKALGRITVLIAVASMVMMVGALFVMFGGGKFAMAALVFGWLLSLFLGNVMSAIMIQSLLISPAFAALKQVVKLVAVAAITMMIGALFMMIPNAWWYALLFTGIFAAYLNAIFWTITFWTCKNPEFKWMFASMFMVNSIVATCTATLLIGALFMMIPGAWKNALVFTGIFATYLNAILGTYCLWSNLIEETLPISFAFSMLVAISAATLLAGGTLFVMEPNLIWGVVVFGVELTAFVYGITWVYNQNAKSIEKAMAPAAALSLLVAISSAVMLTGGLLFMKWPMLAAWVALFTLVLSGMVLAIGGICLLLKHFEDDLKKGEKLMLGIIGLVALAGIAMNIIANAFLVMDRIKNPGKNLAIMAGLIIGVAAMAAGLAWLNRASGETLAEGELLLAGVIGIIVLTGIAMQEMAVAIEALNKVKNVKWGRIFGIVTGFIGLAWEIALGMMGISLPLAVACVGIASLNSAISSIANAVKDYAELKIPVYEGTKKVGYRNLTENDFDSAARNVKKVVTVLGGAIIAVYRKNPEMFETNFWGNSPFSKAVKSFKTLGPLISSIAHAVKDFADLKIVEEWKTDKNGNLKASKYRHLTDGDFDSANTNIIKIITVLGGAIITAYDKNPEMFETNMWGNSPFSKAVKSLKMLGPLISSIASSVKDYADLKIAEEWKADKNGNLKPSKYRHLKDSDFTSAANNVVKIVTILGGAVIRAYDENKNMFESSGAFGMGDSPFNKVVKSLKELGPLISTIATAVENYANMKIANYEWDEKNHKLVIKSYTHLTDTHYKKASENIGTVIKTLGGAIIEVYDDPKNKDMFDSTGLFGNGDSKFAKVIGALKPMGELITSLAEGIENYANMKIANYEWDDKAHKLVIKSYTPLTNDDFTNAATTIKTVITTLAEAITTAFDGHEDWIDDGEDSKAMVAFKAVSNLGNTVKNIADGIKLLATATIPEYNKEGKIIGQTPIGSTELEKVKNVVKDIITAVAGAILDAVRTNPEYFDDGEDSEAVVAFNAVGNLAGLIKNVAEAIKILANAAIPVYNKDGKIIKQERLKAEDITNAKQAISDILTAIGAAIINVFTNPDNREYFDDGEDSEAMVAAKAIGSMTGIVKDTADAIVAISTATIPEYNKDGKIVKQTYVGGDVIQNAYDIIAGTPERDGIITVIGKALVDTVKRNPDLFDDEEDSKVMIAANAIGSMTEIISTIGKTIKEMASGGAPVYVDGKIDHYEKISKEDIETASTAIQNIIAAIGQAIVDVGTNHAELFSYTFDRNGNIIGDTTIVKVVSALQKITPLIGTIGKTVVSFAKGYPIYENGKFKRFEKISPDDINAAKGMISDMMASIGEGLNMAYVKNPALYDEANNILDIFKSNKANSTGLRVAVALSKVAPALSEITKTVLTFGIGIPRYNKDKQLIGYTKIWKGDILKAEWMIARTMMAIGNGLQQAYDADPLLYNYVGFENSKPGRVIKVLNEASKTLADLGKNLLGFSMGFPVQNDDGTTQYVTLDTALIESNIKGTLSAPINGIVSVCRTDEFTELVEKNYIGKDGAMTIALGNMISTVNTSTDLVNAIHALQQVITEPEGGDLIANFLGPVIKDIEDSAKVISEMNFAFVGGGWSIPEIIDQTGQSMSVLAEGIRAVMSAVQATKQNSAFGKNIIQLQKFIQNTVNQIDTQRVDKLLALINALNALAEKTTNLDELTNAIANNLTDVLSALTQRMDEAKETIATAEKVQTKRHALINSSIEKIKNIMSQQINVVVTADTSSTPGATPTGLTDPSMAYDPNAFPSTPSPMPTGGGGGGGGDGGVGGGNNAQATQKKKYAGPSPYLTGKITETPQKKTTNASTKTDGQNGYIQKDANNFGWGFRFP